jgi:hypothetical protein
MEHDFGIAHRIHKSKEVQILRISRHCGTEPPEILGEAVRVQLPRAARVDGTSNGQ